MFKEYQCVMQEGPSDCGVSCLLTIIRTYGGNVSLEYLRELTKTNKNGTNALLMINAMNELGFSSKAVSGSIFDLEDNMFPCIAHVIVDNSLGHFIVIHRLDRKKKILTVADPAIGRRLMSYSEFLGITTNTFLLFTPTKVIPNIEEKSNLLESVILLLSKYKKIFSFIFLFSFICVIINIITSYNLQFIIDNVITNNSKDNLKFIIYIMIFLNIIRATNNYIRDNLLNYVNHELDYILISDIFKHIVSLPYLYYKNRTSGEVISRITDLSEVRNMISNLFVTIFVDLTLVIFVFFSLISISFKLTFISMLIGILYFILTYLFNYIIKKNVKNVKENSAIVNSCLYESINSIDTIKGLSIEDRIIDRFLNKYNKYLNISFNYNKIIIFQDLLKNLIDYIGILLILLFGSLLVLDGRITLSELITFNSLIIYFLDPIKNIISFNIEFNKVKESIRRVDELYNIKKEDLSIDYKYTNNDFIGNISIKDLSYSYDNRNNILSDINLDINKGEKVLITGESGSGKSTLVKLLLKYFKVDNNHISFDNKDINYFNTKELRSKISYVSQNEILYNESLFENVTIDHYIDYDKFLEICNITKVVDVMNKNPLGASFIIEENGFNLSGGERQRIVLARSLVQNSEIYIFDESLSQIDIDNERIILKNIFSKYKDKTFLVISHRLDNSDLYDKHLILKDGVIS